MRDSIFSAAAVAALIFGLGAGAGHGAEPPAAGAPADKPAAGGRPSPDLAAGGDPAAGGQPPRPIRNPIRVNREEIRGEDALRQELTRYCRRAPSADSLRLKSTAWPTQVTFLRFPGPSNQGITVTIRVEGCWPDKPGGGPWRKIRAWKAAPGKPEAARPDEVYLDAAQLLLVKTWLQQRLIEYRVNCWVAVPVSDALYYYRTLRFDVPDEPEALLSVVDLLRGEVFGGDAEATYNVTRNYRERR